jgi:AcrR family transcriptional regulator
MPDADPIITGPLVQITEESVVSPLPMAGERHERADAAINRKRILQAARTLLAEHGVEGLTMQAVASAAGVGKGTVFHRFGDRDGLTGALIDEYMREFQDGFLRGPPPLGPGAPPSERLEAFFAELVRLQVDHLELALAAENAPARELLPVYGALLIHVAGLIAAIDPTLDAHILGGFLLSAIAPPVLHRMHSRAGIEVSTMQQAAIQLIRGITRPAGPSPHGPLA